MTREEAIARIKDHMIVHKMHEPRTVYISEALDMAMQALSQEPTVQDKQAESEKYQKAFDDGYANGYEQARFDYEQEPCTDAVSREAMFDEAFEVDTKEYGRIEVVGVDAIDALPPVTPSCDKCAMNGSGSKYCDNCTQKSGKWISVSERLPEAEEEVLVSGYDTYNKKVIIAKYQGEQYGFTCGLVSAWMPLPKPYEPQERSNKE